MKKIHFNFLYFFLFQKKGTRVNIARSISRVGGSRGNWIVTICMVDIGAPIYIFIFLCSGDGHGRRRWRRKHQSVDHRVYRGQKRR